jgi:hypothetical protein
MINYTLVVSLINYMNLAKIYKQMKYPSPLEKGGVSMRKYLIIIAALFALASVSAVAVDPRYVVGTVYDSSNNPISGASVTADCNGDARGASTDSEGDYWIDYSDSTMCDEGDTVEVEATVGSATAEGSGTMKDFAVVKLAIVDVFIPEFTTIAALAALGGAAAIVYVKRRKN